MGQGNPLRSSDRDCLRDAQSHVRDVVRAAAASLRGKNDMPADLSKPEDPEKEELGKAWVKKHLPRKYKETIDQPRFVGHISLTECRDSSRSFRKLVKELEQRLPLPPATVPPAV